MLMKAVESSLKLISFHMPALGRCNIISTGIGGSVTSKAVMSSTMAASITGVCSLGIGEFSNRLAIHRVFQKTRVKFCRNAVHHREPAFSKSLPAFPADQSGRRRCHRLPHNWRDCRSASAYPATGSYIVAARHKYIQTFLG